MKSKNPETNLIANAMWGTVKLGLAGATIFAIGWGFLTFGPEGEVKESQADIGDLTLMAPLDNTQRFVKALDNLGHEKPRIYNYNGTQVYFSTRASPKKPRELIKEYQEAFVEEGVNKKVYDVRVDFDALAAQGEDAIKKEADARVRAMLEGEVQVLYHDDNRVVMGSALIDRSKAKPEFSEGKEDGTLDVDFQFKEVFKAHRYIEATWHPVRQESFVTASWGDEDFDIKKTLPTSQQDPETRAENNSTDLIVPTCLGCERLTRFATDANDKPYVFQIFKSSQDQDQVEQFYRKAMLGRGWQETKHAKHLADFSFNNGQEVEDGKILQFKKGRQNVTLTVHPEPTGSTVSAILSD